MKHTRKVIEQVAFWHRVPVRVMMGRSRSYPVVAARFDAIAAIYINCRIGGKPPNLCDLGRIFDRDHTTIHQALAMRGLKRSYREPLRGGASTASATSPAASPAHLPSPAPPAG